MTDTKTDEKATRPNELRRMADGMSEGYGLGDLELGWTDTISLLRGSADEIETLNALIGQLMQIAHCDALFNGGHGDRDPVVGFSLIMAEWNRICAENDNYETEIERLRSELVTANHRVAGLTETLAKEMSVPTKRQARQLEIDGFEPVAVTFSNGATRITKSYDGWSCTTIVQPGSIAVFPDNLDECLRWAAAISEGQSPKGTPSDKRRLLSFGFEPSMVEHYSGYQMKWRNPKWELAFYAPARTIMLTERASAKTVRGQLLAPLLDIVETHL